MKLTRAIFSPLKGLKIKNVLKRKRESSTASTRDWEDADQRRVLADRD